MDSQGPSRQPWVRRHPVLVDSVVAALALLADAVLAPRFGDNPQPSTAVVVLTALTLALVPLRHRRLVPTLVAGLVAASLVLMLAGPDSLASLAPLSCLYLVALRRDRRSAVRAWVVVTVVLFLAGAIGAPDGEELQVLPLLPWSVIALVLGDAVKSRRAYLAAVEERAERAERTREEEAWRRVAEERVRIARELHDVVAHHTAVVTVQAGVAQHLLRTQPEAAAAALAQVRHAAAAVLDELGDILSVLREPDGALAPGTAGDAGSSGDGRAPTPGLDRIDALVASFTAAGLEVRWSMEGRPRPLPGAVDLVAYRVVEESLTNALKHGTGEARLSVAYAGSSLRLRVENPVRSLVPAGAGSGRPAGVGTGHGMLGMRERATAVGGTLAAGPSSDRFTVEAVLPLRESDPPVGQP